MYKLMMIVFLVLIREAEGLEKENELLDGRIQATRDSVCNLLGGLSIFVSFCSVCLVAGTIIV